MQFGGGNFKVEFKKKSYLCSWIYNYLNRLFFLIYVFWALLSVKTAEPVL